MIKDLLDFSGSGFHWSIYQGLKPLAIIVASLRDEERFMINYHELKHVSIIVASLRDMERAP